MSRINRLERDASKQRRANERRQGRLPPLSERARTSILDLDGDLDGLKKDDPRHIMHPEGARYENYLGCAEDKGLQRRVERIIPGLKRLDSEKEVFTALDTDTYINGADDVKIKLTSEQRKVPRKELFLVYLRGRIKELTAIRKARRKRLSRKHPDHAYHEVKLDLQKGRFEVLEAITYHMQQDLDLAFPVIWYYCNLLVSDYFRAFGSHTLSKFDESILDHMDFSNDAHMASSTRMRDLARSSVKQDLLDKAKAHYASTLPRPPARQPPQQPHASPGGGPPGGGPPKTGPQKGGPPKGERRPYEPQKPGGKFDSISKALGVPGTPDEGEGYKAWKARLEEKYTVRFGKPWAPTPPAAPGGQAPGGPPGDQG